MKKLLLAIFLASFFILSSGGVLVSAYPLKEIEFTLKIEALGKVYGFCYPEIDECSGELYLKNLVEVVDGIYYDTLQKPVNASAYINPQNDNPFEFEKEVLGKAIDREDLALAIEKSLKKRKGVVVAKEVSLVPEITVEKLKKSTYRRSFFTTNYAYSTEERKYNIALAVNYLGGIMLLPNEEFSFNERVGERSESRGFKSARVIEKGKFVDGVGGGVCQVSSTLYNAVLLAGLNVSERHPHSLSVSYVEPSFDAMVSMSYADLKVVNCTGGIVFIIAKTNSDNVEISIYGEKSQFSYNRVSVVKEKIAPPEIERVYSDALLKGEEKISVYPKFGVVSEGYLETYQNGKLINKKRLSLDEYLPLQGLLLYG